MVVRIIGVTGREDLPPGRVTDLPDDEAVALIEGGYAVPSTAAERDRVAVETRRYPGRATVLGPVRWTADWEAADLSAASGR